MLVIFFSLPFQFGSFVSISADVAAAEVSSAAFDLYKSTVNPSPHPSLSYYYWAMIPFDFAKYNKENKSTVAKDRLGVAVGCELKRSQAYSGVSKFSNAFVCFAVHIEEGPPYARTRRCPALSLCYNYTCHVVHDCSSRIVLGKIRPKVQNWRPLPGLITSL